MTNNKNQSSWVLSFALASIGALLVLFPEFSKGSNLYEIRSIIQTMVGHLLELGPLLL